MSFIEIIGAIKKVMEKVPGVDTCMLGAPLEPAPGDTFIIFDWDTDYSLNESGGVADDITKATIVSVISGGGKPDMDYELALQIDNRIKAFKEALEKDVTLDGLVGQAVIKRSTAQVVPLSESLWEAGCRIEVEVTSW